MTYNTREGVKWSERGQVYCLKYKIKVLEESGNICSSFPIKNSYSWSSERKTMRKMIRYNPIKHPG